VLVETRRAPEGVRGPDEVTEPTRASEVREDHRLVRNAVRSVAAARARGLPVPEDAAARLQHTVKAYLAALDPEECGIIAKCKPGQMSDLLENRRAPEGVRNPAAMANVLRTNGSVPRQALEYDEDLDDTMRTFTLAPV
jgi:hypothetical protein